MTNQEKEAWLRRYREHLNIAKMYRCKAEEMMDILTGTTSKISDEPRANAGGNPREDAYIRHLEYISRIHELQLAAEQAADEIEQAIDRIADPDCRDILRMRYIQGYRWQAIADAMICDRATIFRKRNKALSMLETKT